jgi:thioredoxin-like negative regulator of GroEL
LVNNSNIEGENIDNTELMIKLNLAHAYLLNGDYRAAKSIYKEYQNQNITTSLTSWVQKLKMILQSLKSGVAI